jgi:hypothetical protein
MAQLTRRQILVGTAATALAAAVPFAASSPLDAAAPAVGRQAPGFYRYKVGSIEVTVVTDGINRLPITDSFVLNAKKDEVNAALAAAISFSSRGLKNLRYANHLFNNVRKSDGYGGGTIPSLLAVPGYPQDMGFPLEFAGYKDSSKKPLTEFAVLLPCRGRLPLVHK